MDMALSLGAIIGLSLGYALHGILLLRWCGLWSRNRRLVLWVSQMAFPYVTGGAGVFLGAMTSLMLFGDQELLAWGSAPVDAIAWASWLLPAIILVTVAFLLGPACVLWRHWPVWASGGVSVVAAWGMALAAGLLTYDDNTAFVAALAGWHVAALGPPLLVAWRVRAKRRLALGGRACLDCGYDLAGVTLDRCPECGAKR